MKSPEEIVEKEASYDRAEQSFPSKNLTVEIKCPEVDEWISKVLDVLRTYGVPHEKIKIQQSPQADVWPSGSKLTIDILLQPAYVYNIAMKK